MADGVVDATKPQSSGISLPTALVQIRANFAQVALHIADSEDAHGLATLLAAFDALLDEVVAARGSTNGLSQRLGISFNADGTLKVPITQNNLSEWVDLQTQPVQVDTSSFYVTSDMTSIFIPYRKVMVQTSTNNYVSMVLGSTYDVGQNRTTVQVYDAVVPGAPTNVMYGFVTPAATGSLDLRMLTPTWLHQYNAGGF
jgi:hypothetical protein